MLNRRAFLTQVAAASVSSVAFAKQKAKQVLGTNCAFAAPPAVLEQARLIRKRQTSTTAGGSRTTSFQKTSLPAMPLGVLKRYKWKSSSVSVSFFGQVDDNLAESIAACSKAWTPYSGVEFKFVPSAGDIRIEVVPDNFNWSKYGTEALEIDAAKPTMHFGSITSYSDPADIYHTVVHEFGHALGALHEHQSPAAGFNWDRDVVTAHYKNVGWTDQMIEDNIFKAFPADAVLFTRLDPSSIMIYDFPPSFTKDHFSVHANPVLSKLDKSGMKQIYENDERTLNKIV